MSNKKQSSYLYNARKSLGTLGSALMDDYLPNTKANAGTIMDGVKSVGASGGKGGSMFGSIKTKIKSNPVFTFVNTATKNAFNGLKTGKFYSDPLDIDIDIDDNFDFGDDFFFEDGDSSVPSSSSDDSGIQTSRPVSDGGASSAAAQATMASANQISSTIQGSITEGDRAVIDSNLNVSRALAETINTTIISVGADLKAVLSKTDITLTNQFEHIKALATMQEVALKTQGEVLVELKAIREMNADIGSKSGGNSNNKDDGAPAWYTALKKGDLLGGGKSMFSDAMRAVDGKKTQGVFSTLLNMAPLLTTMYATNPLGLVKDFWLNNKLNEKLGLQDFANKFDGRMKSVADTVDAGARTLSLSDNETLRVIGDAIRTKPDITSSMATDKYDKHKRVFFDGLTKESIVTVIPAYLSSMVSLLSGKEKTAYNYDSGQFQTMSEITAKFYEDMPKLEFEYSKLSKMLKEHTPEDLKDGMDEKKMENFAKVMMEGLADRGYTLSNYKDAGYNKALELLNVNSDQLSESDFNVTKSIMAKIEDDPDTQAAFMSLNKNMNNYIKNKSDYLKKEADNLRTSGRIHTVNKSWSMDNGSVVGLRALAGSGDSNGGTLTPLKSQEHLLSNAGRIEMEDSTAGKVYLNEKDRQKDISMFGKQLSEENIEMVRDHETNVMGGGKRLVQNAKKNLQFMLSSKMFQKLGVHDQEWYKDFASKSEYNLDDILSGKFVEKELRDAGLEEAIVESHLESYGVDKESAEGISKIISNESLSKEEKSEIIKVELGKKGFFDAATGKMKNMSSSIKDKATDIYSYTKDKMKSAADSISGGIASGKDAIVRNKETIMKVSKAALFGGAAIAGFKAIKSTGLGELAGAFGLMSPIAMGAVALGAGVYAKRTDLFGRLFGDSDKAKATGQKALNITKTALFGAGVTGGLSAILNLASGGTFGMMAPVSMALSGLALGIAGENKGFKKMMFGTEEGSFMGNMKVWLLGDKAIGKEGLLGKYGANVKGFLKNTAGKMQRFFEVDIVKPLTDMYKPVTNFISRAGNSLLTAITGIPTSLGDSLGKGLKMTVLTPLMQKLDQSFITPIGNFVKGIFSKGGSILGKIISAPFKFMRTLITGKTDKSIFAETHGSAKAGTDEFTGDKAKYEDSIKSKRELSEANKYKNMKDLESENSKSDFKALRKMRAKEAMLKNPIEEKGTKSMAERLAEYKEYNKNNNSGKNKKNKRANYKAFKEQDELGKGIDSKTAKKYYNNQKDKSFKNMIFGGGNVSASSHGCGLMVISQALSISLNERILPNHLSKDVDSFQSGSGGINHTFFSYICSKYGVPSSTYNKPGRAIIEGALKKKASVICTIEDIETKSPHYILITDSQGGDYIYSDPAREPNMTMAKGTILANITTATIVFEAVKESATSVSVPMVNAQESTPIHSTGSVTDGGDVGGAMTGTSNTQVPVSGGGRRSQGKVSSMNSASIIQALDNFRASNMDGNDKLREDLSTHLNGVAYNVEYMKRILAKKFGKVDDKDMGSSKATDVLTKYTGGLMRFFKKSMTSIQKGIKSVYDNTVGQIVGLFRKATNSLFTSVGKMISFIGSIPEKIALGVKRFAVATKDAIMSIIPSKETMKAVYSEVKGFIKGTYNEIKSLTKYAFTEIKSAALYTVDKLGKMATFTMDKMQTAAVWLRDAAMTTLKTVGAWSVKAFNWFKKTSFGNALMNPISTIKNGLNKLRGKSSASPREVFISGGTINTVQTVEVVKAMGAVDLDYAESMSKKIKSNNDIKSVSQSVTDGKSAVAVVSRAKSPNPKTGAEYAIIKARQDADGNKGPSEGPQGEPKKEEEKESFFSKMMKGFRAFGGILIPAITTAVGGAIAGISLFANTEKGHDIISKIYDKMGTDGDYNADRFAVRGKRQIAKLAVKVGSNIINKTGPKVKDLSKKIFNPSKASKSVSKYLKAFFSNGKVRSMLGGKFCANAMKTVPAIAMQGAKQGTKKATEGAIRTAAYALPPAGLLLDIGYILYDISTGMFNDAERLFGVKKKDLNATMRAVAGTVKALQGFIAGKGPLIVMAFIPTDWLVKLLYKATLSEEDLSKYTKAQAEYNEEVDKELAQENAKLEAEGKAPMTRAQYLDKKHRSVFAKVKDWSNETKTGKTVKAFAKTTPIYLYTKAVMEMADSFKKHGFVGGLKDMGGKVTGGIRTAGDKISAKLEESSFGRGVKSVGKGIGKGIKAMSKTSPLYLYYKSITAMTEAFSEHGFLGGLGALAGKMVNTVEDMYDSFKGLFVGEGFLSKMVEYVKNIPDKIGEFFSGIYSSIKDFGNKAIDKIMSIPETIKEFGSSLVDKITAIPEKIGEFSTFVVDNIHKLPGLLMDKMISVKDKLFDFGNRIYDGIMGIPAYLKDIWTSITELPERIYKWGKQKVDDAVSSVKDGASNLWNKVSSPFKAGYDAERSKSNAAKNNSVATTTVSEKGKPSNTTTTNKQKLEQARKVDKNDATANELARLEAENSKIEDVNTIAQRKHEEDMKKMEAEAAKLNKSESSSVSNTTNNVSNVTTSNTVTSTATSVQSKPLTYDEKITAIDTKYDEGKAELDKRIADIKEKQKENKKKQEASEKSRSTTSIKPIVEPKVEPKVTPVVESKPISKPIVEPKVTPVVSITPTTVSNSEPDMEDVNVVAQRNHEAEMQKIIAEGEKLSSGNSSTASEPITSEPTPVLSMPIPPQSDVSSESDHDRKYREGMESVNQRRDELISKIAASKAERAMSDPLSGFGPLDFFENLDDNFITNLLNFGKSSSSESGEFGEMGGSEMSIPSYNSPDVNYDPSTLKPKEYGGDNSEQIKEMYHTAKRMYGPKIAQNLVRIAWAESNWVHTSKNSIGAEGLFQVLKSTRTAWGFKKEESPRTFSPVEQMKRVAPALLGQIKRKNAEPNLLNMYSALHYPISVGKPLDWVLYGQKKDPRAYAGNKNIDLNYGNKDGNVTMNEMNNFVSRGAKNADARFKTMGGYGDIKKFISQSSSSWNQMSMGPFSFKDAGCGPSVMAMLLDSLGIKYDMNYLVERAVQSKSGLMDGTPMTYFKMILAEHNISSNIFTDNVPGRFVAELNAGKNPILLTHSSTGSNHYIIGRGISGDKIAINDPEKSSTEHVSSDDRITQAKAILVYNTGESSGAGVSDIVKGAYGALSSLISPHRNGHKKLLNNLDSAVRSKIDKVAGKNELTRSIAKGVVDGGMSKLRGYADSAFNPLDKFANNVIGTEDKINRGITNTINGVTGGISRGINDTVRGAKNLVKQPVDDLKDIQRVINDTKSVLKSATGLAGEVPKMIDSMKGGGSSSESSTGGSFNSPSIEGKLDQLCSLMTQLVNNTLETKKSITVNNNGKEVYQTIGGKPTPLINNNDGDKFYDLVSRIAGGSA